MTVDDDQALPGTLVAFESGHVVVVLDQLDGPGVALTADVADDGQVPQAVQKAPEVERLLRGHVGPRMMELGLVARVDDRGDPVLQFAPPLVAGPAELEELTGIVRKVLTEACALR